MLQLLSTSINISFTLVTHY